MPKADNKAVANCPACWHVVPLTRDGKLRRHRDGYGQVCGKAPKKPT